MQHPTPLDNTLVDDFLKMMASILNHVKETQSEMVKLTKVPPVSLQNIERYASEEEMLYWLQMLDIADQQVTALILMLEGMKKSIDLYLSARIKELPHLEALTFELNTLLAMAQEQKKALQGNIYKKSTGDEVDFF